MNVVEKVYAVLSADAALTALVPASRIKPPGDWQGQTLPYIVHFPVFVQTDQTHNSGLINLKNWLYQVSCFGASYKAAKQVSSAVVAALGSYRAGGITSHYSGERTMPYEGDFRVQQIVLEFDIWESL